MTTSASRTDDVVARLKAMPARFAYKNIRETPARVARIVEIHSSRSVFDDPVQRGRASKTKGSDIGPLEEAPEVGRVV